ncbi:hypothetical protein DesfrDRAFT_2160 [Solidesulfovibrio fructosivorans JJ]]|uniref:Uncharacterized protein n=1 Tax=Solidesulfovibrio fructosivorans JJ] TaxID=596151 RepID=E1JX36_SOLFR|nr:hypothetical protein [Solidesulfovibrio fructosivorans]EFL51001.1 hypothetical protein DesfrDRAFT_2160 [Solidesulfovibrio fructosivorans JJ]]
MKKFRVYFATKVHVTYSWFRRKKDVSETDYVVVLAHNEAHAHKEAKKYVDMETLGMPFQVTHITPAADDEIEGRHGSLGLVPPPAQESPQEAGELESNTPD